MAKKRRRSAPAAQKYAPAGSGGPRAPKFELGVKGDEFDLRYTKAAAAPSVEADSLLRSLSKESRAAGFNLLNFAVLALVWVMFALSFALLSRSGSPPRVRGDSLADGSYTAGLSAYYKDELPFGNAIKSLGAILGFCDAPESEQPPEQPEENMPALPAVTEPVETEPVTTTAPPTTTEAPTSAPLTEPTETTIPETRTMYASATLNIRISPDTDAMILGYFSINQEIEVIEISDDGWASIWYNDSVAYVSAEFIGEKTVATTRERKRTTTEEPETEPPEETEAETTTEEETTAVTEETVEETTEETTTQNVYEGHRPIYTTATYSDYM